MLRLKNKTALITGGAKGAGAASARRFAEEGERVMIADRDAEAAACFSDKMRAEGFDIGWVHADMALVEGALTSITTAVRCTPTRNRPDTEESQTTFSTAF